MLEAIGTYVSILGLSALFAASVVIIVLAATLDLAKVVTVSFLYKFWGTIPLPLRMFLCAASVVLITITSTGAFGYMSGEFQKSMASISTQSIVIDNLKQEQDKLQKRKIDIDSQVADINAQSVKSKAMLMRQYAPEINKINSRLAEIDKQLPALQIEGVDKAVHMGPIMYVAKAFDTSPEEAVKYVIFTIMFVFDPLAIALLIAGNFLAARNSSNEKDEQPREVKVILPTTDELQEPHVVELEDRPEEGVVDTPVEEIVSVDDPIPEPVAEDPKTEDKVDPPVEQIVVEEPPLAPAIPTISTPVPELKPSKPSRVTKPRAKRSAKLFPVASILDNVAATADVQFNDAQPVASSMINKYKD